LKNSLEKIIISNPPLSPEEILKKEGIKHYEKDIRVMTSKEIRYNFKAESSENIIISKVISEKGDKQYLTT